MQSLRLQEMRQLVLSEGEKNEFDRLVTIVRNLEHYAKEGDPRRSSELYKSLKIKVDALANRFEK